MSFDFNQLTHLFLNYMLPFVRISACMMVLPILGSTRIPPRIRLMLSVTLTLAIAPHVTIKPIDIFSVLGVLVITEQVLIGLCSGFVIVIVVQAFILAGQVIAMQTGLGFAQMVDPTTNNNIPMVSQLYLLLVSLIYLAIDGHLAVINLLAQSFDKIPIGFGHFGADYVGQLLAFSATMFIGAIKISIPAVIALLIVNVSFGVMTRAAPQLNIFAVGFPITLTLGLIIVYLMLANILPLVRGQFNLGFKVLTMWWGVSP